jgi:hypothetical protein
MTIISSPASKLLLSVLVMTALVAMRFAACKVCDCSCIGACCLSCAGIPVLQQQGISFTWTTEGELVHGLKGYRKLEGNGEGSTSPPTSAPTGGPTSPAPTSGPTSPPTSAPSIPNNGVAIGGAFGTGSASASVSSTGGRGGAFGRSENQGYSSSFAEKPSGAKAMTDSSGRGTAQTDASVNVVDQTLSSGYSNVQNSGYAASVSVTGDTINPIDTVLEDLTAEFSKDVPFFGLFGGFGAILVGADPDDSTSDTSISGEDASNGNDGTSDTETIEVESATAGTVDDASDGGTSNTEIMEEESSATAGTVENTDEESEPVASGYQRSQSEGGYYGSFGASP